MLQKSDDCPQFKPKSYFIGIGYYLVYIIYHVCYVAGPWSNAMPCHATYVHISMCAWGEQSRHLTHLLTTAMYSRITCNFILSIHSFLVHCLCYYKRAEWSATLWTNTGLSNVPPYDDIAIKLTEVILKTCSFSKDNSIVSSTYFWKDLEYKG